MAEDDTSCSSYDDWVTDQISDVMKKAGDKFISEHPDLFRTNEVT